MMKTKVTKAAELRRRGWLTLPEILASLTKDGVSLGGTGIRTIRYYQVQGIIDRPICTTGPDGQPNFAYYPPGTVRKIAKHQRRLRRRWARAALAGVRSAFDKRVQQAFGLPPLDPKLGIDLGDPKQVRDAALFLLAQFDVVRKMIEAGELEHAFGDLLDYVLIAKRIRPALKRLQ